MALALEVLRRWCSTGYGSRAAVPDKDFFQPRFFCRRNWGIFFKSRIFPGNIAGDCPRPFSG
jgi:hypothetical protein